MVSDNLINREGGCMIRLLVILAGIMMGLGMASAESGLGLHHDTPADAKSDYNGLIHRRAASGVSLRHGVVLPDVLSMPFKPVNRRGTAGFGSQTVLNRALQDDGVQARPLSRVRTQGSHPALASPLTDIQPLALNLAQAQATSPSASAAAPASEMSEEDQIAEALANPLSYLWLLFMQNDTIWYDGDIADALGEDAKIQNSFLLNPVLSFQLTKKWKTVIRPVIPINSFEAVP